MFAAVMLYEMFIYFSIYQLMLVAIISLLVTMKDFGEESEQQETLTSGY